VEVVPLLEASAEEVTAELEVAVLLVTAEEPLIVKRILAK